MLACSRVGFGLSNWYVEYLLSLEHLKEIGYSVEVRIIGSNTAETVSHKINQR